MSGSDYLKNTDPLPLWADDIPLLTTPELERLIQAAQAELDKRCNVANGTWSTTWCGTHRKSFDPKMGCPICGDAAITPAAVAARNGFINRLDGHQFTCPTCGRGHGGRCTTCDPMLTSEHSGPMDCGKAE